MAEKSRRENYIDAAKGIGIICVMLGHSCGVPVVLSIFTGFNLELLGG